MSLNFTNQVTFLEWLKDELENSCISIMSEAETPSYENIFAIRKKYKSYGIGNHLDSAFYLGTELEEAWEKISNAYKEITDFSNETNLDAFREVSHSHYLNMSQIIFPNQESEASLKLFRVEVGR